MALAGFGICTSVRDFGVLDGMSWDDSEPTSAVRQATDDLDGYRFTADDSGTPLCFDDYESLYRIAVGTRKGEC